ncbi:MAG: hypothetical protein ABI547_02785, partial [Betaproteobacteria bacterium]
KSSVFSVQYAVISMQSAALSRQHSVGSRQHSVGGTQMSDGVFIESYFVRSTERISPTSIADSSCASWIHRVPMSLSM